MATMTDVAKEAKVSKMTVSRVLSGRGYVKEETKEAVLRAIEKLQYRPNLLAKSLVTGRTNVLAYALPDICDPFFGNVCRGVADVCRELGYTSIVYNTANPDSLKDFFNIVIDRQVDGVIMHHLCVTQSQIRRLRERGVAVALIDNETTLKDAINLTNDNYHGAFMAVEYLISRGYRRIACVRGDLPASEAPADLSYIESYQRRIWDDRTRGCMDALQRHGLSCAAVYHGRGSAAMDRAFACGQSIVKEILASGDLPDAVYCESDIIALGMLSELLEQKVDVPGKMALTGHDGLDTCRFLYPRVTTVVQPQYEIGQSAAKLLIAQLNGTPHSEDVQIHSNLFVGDTTN